MTLIKQGDKTMDNKNPVLNEQEVSDEAIAKAMAGELTEEQ